MPNILDQRLLVAILGQSFVLIIFIIYYNMAYLLAKVKIQIIPTTLSEIIRKASSRIVTHGVLILLREGVYNYTMK